ncbi:MAG TPA: hypothetical protein VFY13_03565 [Luteolibacter sp.]|nr:hypothetical protein [Luteolibacter sp.]
MTLDINRIVAYGSGSRDDPKWLDTMRADLDEVTTGTFRVHTIGLRQEQIERVEKWARKQLKSQADAIVKQELEREAIKPTPFKIKERREQLLATLRWTTYNNTPVHVAGQPTR